MNYIENKEDPVEIDDSGDLRKFKWKDLSLTNKNCRKEAKAIIGLSLPIAFALATMSIKLFTDQAVVGQLGTDYLAAAALAGVVMAMSSVYIFAFTYSINVLCAQAWGAKNYKLVSEWYQMGCFMSLLMSIPPAIVYIYTEDILHHLFGCNAHIAHLAGIYAEWSIISIVPQTQYMATQMYFQAQSIVMPVVVVNCIGIAFNLLVNLILVYGYIIPGWTGLGFIGSPIATASTSWVQYIIYMIYMFGYKKQHKKTWSKLKLSTFSCNRTKKFLAVAIPQTISVALEEWQFQVITLFTSRLDEVSVAAFASLGTIILMVHCFAIGLSDAICVKVGNALGSNRPNYAKYISWVAIIIALISGSLTGGLFGAFGQYTAHIVSSKHEMFEIYKQVCPIVGISFFMLNLLSANYGILTGQARITGIAVLSLVGCWGVSVPLAYVLGIHLNYGDRGIFLGLIAGYLIFSVGSVILFFMTDWKKSALDAVKRSEKEEEEKLNQENQEQLLIN